MSRKTPAAALIDAGWTMWADTAPGQPARAKKEHLTALITAVPRLGPWHFQVEIREGTSLLGSHQDADPTVALQAATADAVERSEKNLRVLASYTVASAASEAP